jgi:predicted chitinase
MSNKLNKVTINSMVSTLFPRTKNIGEVVDIIYTYGSKFGVNTNLRLAHYLAQVREEIGDNFEPKAESFNYSKDALIKTIIVFIHIPITI